MEKQKKQWLGLCMSGCLLATGNAAHAESDPDNIIKYRKHNMKALGAHMGATAQIVRGKVPYRDHLVFHAESIDVISRRVVEMFPEGSDFGDTKAKEAVWDKHEAFNKASKEAEKSAAEYLEAARSGDQAAIQKSFRSLSNACKGCHKKFREKDG